MRVEEAVNSLFGWIKWTPLEKTSKLVIVQSLYNKSRNFIDGLFRYSVNVAVGDSWRAFSSHLDDAVGNVSDALISDVNSLRLIHHQTLDRIHWRLFLRPNQRKMAGLLDETMEVLFLLTH